MFFLEHSVLTPSQFLCMGARHGPPQSTRTLVLIHLICEHYARSWVLYTRHVSNVEVKGTTGYSSLSHLVTNRHLWLFGHTARSSPCKDHHSALAAAIQQVLPDWKRSIGRPSHTRLCTIEADLGPRNFSLTTAWRKATTRDEWRHIVVTATLQWSTLWKKKEKRHLKLLKGGSTVNYGMKFVVKKPESLGYLMVKIASHFGH